MPVSTATDPQSFGILMRQMTVMIEQMHKGYFKFAPGDTWVPSVNLYETETAYVLCVDLAGVDKDKIDVTIDHNVLRLRGHRPMPGEYNDPAAASAQPEAELDPQRRWVRLHLMEIDHGQFSREVQLPVDISQDKITATYRNGLLWIHLPKK
ncbi:Hsp20/alpha crystallin family protein [Fontivita pretiosa]|uniref:Hsp20/alpha crystallin family protein n=1 Tax=Fontivita pretiosa TaxID=2989684 RepID=UPI003D16B5F0